MTYSLGVEGASRPPARSPARYGLRKITPEMMGTDRMAAQFAGDAGAMPGRVLAAFKRAAPFLGIAPRVVHAVDWLFAWTFPQDWEPGQRPIVWPSAATQAADLGLGTSQVKNLNRTLVELGLITMKDSPNRKRYGHRFPNTPKGRIVEAYGFDLSPLGARMDEFLRVAEAGQAERDRCKAIRRRASIARNALRQIAETATEQGIGDRELAKHLQAGGAASKGIARIEDPDELECAVSRLERCRAEALASLEKALAERRPVQSDTVDNDRKGPKNWPHITTTTQLNNPSDTVIALEGSKSGPPKPAPQARSAGVERHGRTKVLGITPEELARLSPRLRDYLPGPFPTWPDIVNAADWLKSHLGISQAIWGEACLEMTREQAAIAVALVAARPPSHFTTSPGGYFNGMVAKARKGELNLSRSLWGLRGGGDANNSH